MSLKLIKIKSKSGYANCEDSSSFDWRETVVTYPDNKQIAINGDRHLGGGPVDDVEVLEEVLRNLGYEVEWEYLDDEIE